MDIDLSRRNEKPRPLSDAEKQKLEEFVESIHYSGRYAPRLSTVATDAPSYSDSEFEFRHVQLPKQMLKSIPKEYFVKETGTMKLLWEEEWRALGITQVCPSKKSGQADRRRVSAGSTTRCTSRSRTSCYSSSSLLWGYDGG
jgi:cyclin-dependent kinase regulatory subunit CKS1